MYYQDLLRPVSRELFQPTALGSMIAQSKLDLSQGFWLNGSEYKKSRKEHCTFGSTLNVASLTNPIC